MEVYAFYNFETISCNKGCRQDAGSLWELFIHNANNIKQRLRLSAIA